MRINTTFLRACACLAFVAAFAACDSSDFDCEADVTRVAYLTECDALACWALVDVWSHWAEWSPPGTIDAWIEQGLLTPVVADIGLDVDAKCFDVTYQVGGYVCTIERDGVALMAAPAWGRPLAVSETCVLGPDDPWDWIGETPESPGDCWGVFGGVANGVFVRLR